MILEFHIKCKLCDNTDESEFYYSPVEESINNEKLFSYTKYKFICKKFKYSFILELEENHG